MTPELLRALARMCEAPFPSGDAPHRLAELLELGEVPAAAVATELFVFELPPFASVYLGSDGGLGGPPRELIAGFFRAFGQAPPDEPDHLATLLGLTARLTEHHERADDEEHRRRWRHARRALFWDHLGSWAPLYADAVRRIGDPFHRRWADLLLAALVQTAEELPPPAERAPHPHLREVPMLPDPRRDGGEAWITGLFAPAVAGFVLTRLELHGIARELGLGARIGERRFVLKALLSQDAEATLERLAVAAREGRERIQELPEPLSPALGPWTERARHSEACSAPSPTRASDADPPLAGSEVGIELRPPEQALQPERDLGVVEHASEPLGAGADGEDRHVLAGVAARLPAVDPGDPGDSRALAQPGADVAAGIVLVAHVASDVDVLLGEDLRAGQPGQLGHDGGPSSLRINEVMYSTEARC